MSTIPPPAAPVAIVLAGGAARGAYEVGVISYVFHEVARALGRPIPVDILCGTSVGAINACTLAAWADDPVRGVELLVRQWMGLRIDQLVRVNKSELLGLVRGLVSLKRPPPRAGDERRGGVLDATGIERLVEDTIPFPRISEHVRTGKLQALTVSTTDVATGKTVIFVDHRAPVTPRWSREPTVIVRRAAIRPEHALASAAVPFLFPAVRIDDDFYCDGGLRQNVPLSPARRLGAQGLLVVNPRYIGPVAPSIEAARETSYPGPLFLLGKALNALLLDRIDNDISRLQRINEILEAGVRRHGEGFVDEINQELGMSRAFELRPLRVVHVRASVDIGTAAGEYVRSLEFASRAGAVVGRLLRGIAEWEGAGEADLLAYLLFDGGFAARLIELGRRDAALRHEELCALFAARA